MPKIPTVILNTQSTNVISGIEGHNQCVCTFKSDQDICKWEARALRGNTNPQRGQGKIVESGGYLACGQEATVIIDYDELNQGDGNYVISVYAQSYNGYWSDGTFENSYLGLVYNKNTYNGFRKYNCKE